MKKINVYIGWDSREEDAYNVCKKSILDTSTVDVEIIPLKRNELAQQDLYYRDADPLAATEFTYTRFLVPYLNNYQDIAIFCDCDFLWLTDIKELIDTLHYPNNSFFEKAVYVCKHEHTPTNALKMDNKVQTIYPRKNWSSLIVWNCQHEKNKQITVSKVNTETGAFLHRFNWLEDNEIGSIPIQWNWLVDYYTEPKDGVPKALHYTEGGPWFENYKDCSYSQEWLKVYNKI